MKAFLISALVTLVCAASAAAQSQTGTIVLSVTKNSVTWADVYRNPDAPPDDPYLHVRVFVKERGTEPWVYKLVAPHLVVTPEALEASRTSKKGKTYAYKDVEFRYLYREWLKNPETRRSTSICETDILDCVVSQ